MTHLDICELDIRVSPVEAVLLHHQPVLVDGAHAGEHRQQLALETVPGRATLHSGRNQGFFVQWVYWVYLTITIKLGAIKYFFVNIQKYL